MKVETLSGDATDVKEVKILNKIIRWTARGIELEADPHHAEIVVQELGLEGATPSKVPGAKADDENEKPRPASMNKSKGPSREQININNGAAWTLRKNKQKAFGKIIKNGISPDAAKTWIDELSTEGELNAVFEDDGDDGGKEINKNDAKKFRGIAARLNDLAPDRLDIGFAVKEAARNMARPLVGDLAKLNRIGRYWVGRPRMVSMSAWQSAPSTITTYTDSDWTGCKNRPFLWPTP